MINNLQSLQDFKEFLGKEIEIKYVPWNGIRINQNYTRNEIVLCFKNCIPETPNTIEKGEILELLKRMQKMSKSKYPIKSSFEKSIVKLRQKLGNWWFKVTTGFSRKKCLSRIEKKFHISAKIKKPVLSSIWLRSLQRMKKRPM